MKKLLIVLLALGVVAPVGAEQVTKDAILSQEGWMEIYEAAQLDTTVMYQIASQLDNSLRIDVYLAYWCKDSKNNLPPFIKIVEELGEERCEVHYFVVERKASREVKYFIDDLKVERIPTFIFYRDGEEIGRIIENPETSLAGDFLEIIS